MITAKVTKLVIWFQVTCILLIFNIAYLSSYTQGKRMALRYAQRPDGDITTQINAPSTTGKVLGASITSEDARELIVKNFILKYAPNSPFLPHVHTIIHQADQNNIDFRLVPAIAMCESNLGQRIPSKDSYNAWGIAVFTGQLHGKKFNDWEHAIGWVSTYIREKFFAKGITDLREVGAIWAPPSVEKDYSWTRCVEGFMADME